jgi:hypothetical protein
VQFSELVFFENRLFLRCSFADNSEARGCNIRLTLSSTNETESFEVSRESGSLCTTANNQREAYSSVVVSDVEGNGQEGSLILNITQNVVNVTSLQQYMDLTGCRDGKRDGREREGEERERERETEGGGGGGRERQKVEGRKKRYFVMQL